MDDMNIAASYVDESAGDGNGSGDDEDDIDPGDALGELMKEVMVGTQKRKLQNVRCKPVNPLLLRDAVVVMREKMMAKDYVCTRLQAQRHSKRERIALHDSLYRFLNRLGSNSSKVEKKLDAWKG